jgi:hypothetical protein
MYANVFGLWSLSAREREREREGERGGEGEREREGERGGGEREGFMDSVCVSE